MRLKSQLLKLSTIVSLIVIFTPSFYAQQEKPTDQQKPKIAVLDFESIGGGREDFGRGVAEILRTALIETNKYTVIERGMLYKVINEQKLQVAGLTDPKAAVEIGKMTGADTVVVGSVVKFGSSYTITPRFIDVKTAEAKVGKNLTCGSEEEIPETCNHIVGMITGNTAAPVNTYETKSKKEILLTLEGIMYNEKNPCAVINSQVVKIGDKVEGAVVKSISEYKVTLEDGGKEIVLWLEKR